MWNPVTTHSLIRQHNIMRKGAYCERSVSHTNMCTSQTWIFKCKRMHRCAVYFFRSGWIQVGKFVGQLKCLHLQTSRHAGITRFGVTRVMEDHNTQNNISASINTHHLPSQILGFVFLLVSHFLQTWTKLFIKMWHEIALCLIIELERTHSVANAQELRCMCLNWHLKQMH